MVMIIDHDDNAIMWRLALMIVPGLSHCLRQVQPEPRLFQPETIKLRAICVRDVNTKKAALLLDFFQMRGGGRTVPQNCGPGGHFR